MTPDNGPSALPRPLLLTRNAMARGSQSRFRTDIHRGDLVRIRRGAYLDRQTYEQQNATARYRANVLAAMSARKEPVAAGPSAAVLLGLPTIGEWPRSVYVLSPTRHSRSRNGVVEFPRYGDDRLLFIDGRWMTSVVDTVIDTARLLPYTGALALVDAAIHVDRFGRTPPLATLEDLWAEHELRGVYHGCAQVRRVLSHATTLADTPLETLSRVVIDELGFPEPVLQHRLWLPRSQREAFLDVAWPAYRVGGEADGLGKYLGNDPNDPVPPAERVIAEKHRENEIRGLTWTPARWDWGDAWHREKLRAILVEAGLPIVRSPKRIL